MKGPLLGLKIYLRESCLNLNKDKADAFWQRRTKIENPRVATHYKEDDMHVYDIEFIKKHIKENDALLDLGAGTCYLTNMLIPYVSEIKAVDKFADFLNHAEDHPKLTVEACDLVEYKDDKKYNMVMMFGVANFLPDTELEKIYEFISNHLLPNGKFIIKHASGVKKDVVIDNYSELIGDNYHALYRHLDKDVVMLSQYFDNVEVVDIYPDKLNPWDNTHFYAYVCS